MKKKIVFSLLAVVICFALVGCGNKENQPKDETGNNQQGQGSTAIKDITTENWESVVKDNFLLDLTLPEGWEVIEAYSPNNVGNIKAKFKTGGTTTGEDLAKLMFEQSQALGEVNVASFEEAGSFKGIKTWLYQTDDMSVSVNAYFDIEGTFEITINK